MGSNKCPVSDCLRKDIFRAQHITSIPGGTARGSHVELSKRLNN
jgi:hypothetical protein